MGVANAWQKRGMEPYVRYGSTPLGKKDSRLPFGKRLSLYSYIEARCYSAKMPSSAPEAKSLPACELRAVKRM